MSRHGRWTERCDDFGRPIANNTKHMGQFGIEIVAITGVEDEPLVPDLDFERAGQDQDTFLPLVTRGLERTHVVAGESPATS